MLWLFVITCISIAIGGLITILDGGHYAGRTGEIVTPVLLPLKNTEKTLISLEMNQGSINLSSGTGPGIISGTLKSKYSVSGPSQSYSEAGDTGTFVISQEASRFYEIIDKEDEWNLTVSTDVPADVSINCHIGDVSVDTGSLDLSSLQIMSGTGDVLVNLSSYTGKHLPVSVYAGIGSVKILLPPYASVAADTENGIGSRTISGLEGERRQVFSCGTVIRFTGDIPVCKTGAWRSDPDEDE